MRTTFLVGRMTPRSEEMVVADGSRRPAPFPGPWTLRAVVRLPVPPRRSHSPDSPSVH